MILGIGTDIVEINRIAKAIENALFCNRFFTDAENLLFERKGNKVQSIAGNFAAKEAFSKALGTGVRGFALKDIEILRDDLGKPYINLYNNAKLAEDINVHVTISHTEKYAVAYVIIEKIN